jgi:hypothetical protein
VSPAHPLHWSEVRGDEPVVWRHPDRGGRLSADPGVARTALDLTLRGQCLHVELPRAVRTRRPSPRAEWPAPGRSGDGSRVTAHDAGRRWGRSRSRPEMSSAPSDQPGCPRFCQKTSTCRCSSGVAARCGSRTPSSAASVGVCSSPCVQESSRSTSTATESRCRARRGGRTARRDASSTSALIRGATPPSIEWRPGSRALRKAHAPNDFRGFRCGNDSGLDCDDTAVLPRYLVPDTSS